MTDVTEPNSGRWLKEIERTLSPGATLVIAAVSASVLLAVIGSVLSWRTYEDRIVRERETAVDAALIAASSTSQFFAARLAALEALAQLLAPAEDDLEAIGSLLAAAALQQLGFSGGVGWVDRAGFLRAHSATLELPVDLSDRPFVRSVLTEGSPAVGHVVSGRVIDEALVVIAVPTFNGEMITGVLIGYLNADRFGTNVPSLVQVRFQTRVVDRVGRLILVDGRLAPMVEVLNPEVLAGAAGRVGTGLMGEPSRIMGIARAEEAGWTIVVDQDRSLLLSGSRGRFLGELAILVLLSALTSAAAMLAARRMNLSHRQMLAGARSLDALETLTESLSAAPSTKDVADAALSVFGKTFKASLVSIGLLDRDDRMKVFMIADEMLPADPDSPDEVVPLDSRSVLTDAFEASEPVVLSRQQLSHRYPDLETPTGASGAMVRRFLGRNAKGAVGLFVSGDFPPSDSDQELFSMMVPLLGDAFGRAAAAESEQQASRAFQQALLPRDTIDPDVNLQRAVRYIAAVGNVEVGGDWYDLWMVDERQVGAVVGDVVGRGVHAAAAMGQLRSSLRAAIIASTLPDQALARLDDLTRQINDSPSATVVLGIFDTVSRSINMASAGHLPPIHSGASETRVIKEMKGSPIGFLSYPTTRVSMNLQLDLEDTVVLYSDGLVERRDEPIDQGIERLRGVVHANRSMGVEALADVILERCLEIDNPDDVALVVLRPVGPYPKHFTRTARVDDFSPLLNSLEGWLAAQNHRPETSQFVVSRVEEALAVVAQCVAVDPTGEVLVEVEGGENLDVILEFRRTTFGAETDRVNRMILRLWRYGEMTRSGPRLQLRIGAAPMDSDG